MSRIDTLKLNADLLAMHDQPMKPDAADLNTLRDAMTIVSAYGELVKGLRKIAIGEGYYGEQAREYKEIAKAALASVGAA